MDFYRVLERLRIAAKGPEHRDNHPGKLRRMSDGDWRIEVSCRDLAELLRDYDRLDGMARAAHNAKPSDRTVLDGIAEAMETRGYAHMTNGRDIGALLDRLEQLLMEKEKRQSEPPRGRVISESGGCVVDFDKCNMLVTDIPELMAANRREKAGQRG